MNGLALWRVRYEALGLGTMPLINGTKLPACVGWQITPPCDQWRQVGGDGFRGNIGLRTGAGFAVADGDDERTAEHIAGVLTGLGVGLVEVQTVTPGHAQFYLKVKDVPPGFNYTIWPAPLAGELRAGAGAFVVAPRSEVEHTRYKFIEGSPEAWAKLRPIVWHDILRGFGLVLASQRAKLLDALPVRLVKRDMPMHTWRLLLALQTAFRGQSFYRDGGGDLGTYKTRNGAEQCVIAGLVTAGWGFDEIRAVFDEYMPAHFADLKHTQRGRYLLTSYRRVVGWLSDTPERARLAELYQQAATAEWPGRGGGNDRATFMALCANAWQYSTFDTVASVRDLAEHGAMSPKSASKALKRLVGAGLVQRVAKAHGDQAAVWRVLVDNAQKGNTTLSMSPQCVGDDYVELWAWGRLGKSCEMVYNAMDDSGLGVAALVKKTAKNRNTISAALHRLESVGLAQKTAAGWTRGTRSLADVAREFEADKAAARRRLEHKRERAAWAEVIERRAEMAGLAARSRGITAP